MAWYSLYRWFVTFRRTSYVNVINWYRQVLYEEWFNSLGEEEQEKERLRLKNIEEEENTKFQREWLALGTILSLYSNRV
ncbi:MAG: hypothetical protein HFH68_02050 [Lachnospiraceae bacterium]|nr:hypothetical protein [Lachnospiraceae bacterium]